MRRRWTRVLDVIGVPLESPDVARRLRADEGGKHYPAVQDLVVQATSASISGSSGSSYWVRRRRTIDEDKVPGWRARGRRLVRTGDERLRQEHPA
ncbi:MAG: hypothetical protein H5T95_09635 [Firmicutes bacterium]|nr:hypothetical protein [Bacillota bacterium]